MRRRGIALALALASVTNALGSGEARAHARSTSTSSWEIDSGPVPAARVLVRVQWSDLQRVLLELAGVPPSAMGHRADLAEVVEAYLLDHVALYSGDRRCARAGPVLAVPSLVPTDVGRAWRMRCDTPGPAVLRVTVFLEAVPTHLHLARVRTAGGGAAERVFVLDSTVFQPETGEGDRTPTRASGFRDYLALGVEHIATGTDHLVFLLALLLIGVSLAETATIVTGFTIAHSLTLALGVLGVVEPQSSAIEALIGLSIAVVALENFALTTGAETRRWIVASLGAGTGLAALAAIRGAVAVPATALIGVGIFAVAYLQLLRHAERPGRMRWFVALVFGLIHGFGFAGLLVGIGLPPGRMVPALLGFNLGVEFGQLAVVAVVWPLLHFALARGARHRALLVQVGSSLVLVAGLFWFLTRALR